MNGFEWTLELRFVIALALGFLVGLERESARTDARTRVLAGVRTYPIIAMYGFGCAWLARAGMAFALPVGMATIAAFAVAAYLAKLREGRMGWTSETSAALTFVVGALCPAADMWLPTALGVINAILLSEKAELESYVDHLDKHEFLAVLKFLLVTVIILPALPDRAYTRFQLNPMRIWEIVVMVSTIGFVGYFLAKKFGGRIGLPLLGVLGGIVSSTAVCLSMGRSAARSPEEAGPALQASLLASAVMYLRILALVWFVNADLAWALAWKLCVLFAVGAVLSLRPPHPVSAPAPAVQEGGTVAAALRNPFEIRPAVFFALVFVSLTIITVLIRESFGHAGILALSAVVGVTDIDPFILSLAQDIRIASPVSSTALLIAMMSNTVAKGVYVWTLATPVRKDAAIRFGIFAALHVTLLL